MKKLAVILAMLMVCALCFTACGDDGEVVPDGMKRISDPALVGYYLYVPETWVSELNSGVVSAYHSLTDASSIVANQWNLPEGVATVDDWWAQYVPVFENTFNTFALESDEECYLGGVKAHKYVYTAKLPASDAENKDENGLALFRFMQVATIRRGMVYVITYTSLADTFEANLADVQMILDNFKFE
ncbi:MAG: hypothetical protein J6D21_02070 [Clostridia bacterium]|nr:hypothetical protein [Clostridia bacterium]